jgi:hypothetical protein
MGEKYVQEGFLGKKSVGEKYVQGGFFWVKNL